jgi:AcrR family transcriptional regulator
MSRRYHFIDHVNDQLASAVPPRRRTRAEQRAATRLALLDATAACLVEEGYPGLTTRRVAERAGVAQSTLMHYFPTRDEFLIETITHLALRLADEALDQIDLAAMRRPEHRERVLDQAWTEFTSPEALAAGQLWMAAWAEPELAATLRGLEQRLGSIIELTAGTLFPDQAGDERFPALLDTAVSLIRGLVMEIPIWGLDAVTARWQAIRPILADAAAQLLD